MTISYQWIHVASKHVVRGYCFPRPIHLNSPGLLTCYPPPPPPLQYLSMPWQRQWAGTCTEGKYLTILDFCHGGLPGRFSVEVGGGYIVRADFFLGEWGNTDWSSKQNNDLLVCGPSCWTVDRPVWLWTDLLVCGPSCWTVDRPVRLWTDR